MVTDKGPQRQWLWEIGKVEDQQCVRVCDGLTAQIAACLQRYSRVGDGLGRSAEQMWEDEALCERVVEFIA